MDSKEKIQLDDIRVVKEMHLKLTGRRSLLVRRSTSTSTRRRDDATRRRTMDVTWEDQQRICAFSRMNARSHELDAEISAKTRAIDDLDEASTELAFADEEESRGVLLGECFVVVDAEEAEKRVEAMLTREREGLERLKEERKVLREGLAELKTVR